MKSIRPRQLMVLHNKNQLAIGIVVAFGCVQLFLVGLILSAAVLAKGN